MSLVTDCIAFALTPMPLSPPVCLQRIRVTIGNKTLVPAKSADWLLNLCNLSPILMALKPKHLKRLMATCRQLRAVVHNFATTMKFSVSSVQASQYDLHKLGTGNWLNLQTLVLQQTLDAPEVCSLIEGQLPQLTSLQLRLTNCLYASGLLAVGKWPLLQKLTSATATCQ